MLKCFDSLHRSSRLNTPSLFGALSLFTASSPYTTFSEFSNQSIKHFTAVLSQLQLARKISRLACSSFTIKDISEHFPSL